MKMIWYWHKNGHIDQWNRTESPERNSHLYGQLIFDKGDRTIQWNKDSFFNKWCWENWIGTCKKMKLDYQVTPQSRINSTWIKDLNISFDIIKVLDENGSKNSDITCSNIFADISPKAREIKVGKWDNCNSIINKTYQKKKTAMRYHFTPVRMAFINKSTSNKCWRGCGEKGTPGHCWWECRLGQPLWKTAWEYERMCNVTNHQRNAD